MNDQADENQAGEVGHSHDLGDNSPARKAEQVDHSHDLGDNSPARKAEPESEIPSRLGKRARTAYFIFQDEKRAQLREATHGSVAEVAKAIGQLWQALSREEKEVYQLKAAEEREEVSKALQQLKESGQLNLDVGGVDGDNKEGEHGLVLPVARVRKICRLDPEVRGISKEATLLVAKAAEMFTHKLAKETMVIAQMQNRRKCFPEDVVEVCSLKDPYQFLRDDIKDLFREQKALEKKNAPTSKDKVESKHPSVQGTKSITSYFGSSV